MTLHRLHRFFYSTSFTLLFLFLFILLLITPADAVVQAYFRNSQLYNVFVVAGTYVSTAAIALAIYVSRIYSVRSLMAQIPKSHVPVKKMDLPKRVHKAIAGNLSRSAVISVQSKPGAATVVEGGSGGTITHPGWSPPSSVDLPDVHYLSVILELPHLIEAKALSLQLPPPSPTQPLARQPYQTLRAYLTHLATLGYVRSTAAGLFLDGYERARFRTRGEGVEEGEFRDLMRVFAGLLRGMGDHTPVLAPSIAMDEDGEDDDDEKGWRTGDIDGAVDEESAGIDEEGYSQAGSVRRFGYMSLGYETTTTYDEEDGGYYGGVYDPYVEQYAERASQRERERLVERERIRIRNSQIRGNMGGVVMERDGTETTTETSSMGSERGSYGIEMQSLDPGMMGKRLSVRASTGTFG